MKASAIDVVEVLRKRIRGQAVTAQEAAALAAHSRPVRGPSIPHSEIERELEEWKREERLKKRSR